MAHAHLVDRKSVATEQGHTPAYVQRPVLVGGPVPGRGGSPDTSPRACIGLLLGGAPGRFPLGLYPWMCP